MARPQKIEWPNGLVSQWSTGSLRTFEGALGMNAARMVVIPILPKFLADKGVPDFLLKSWMSSGTRDVAAN